MYHSYLADKIEVQVLRGEMKRPIQAYTYGLQYSGTEMNFSRLQVTLFTPPFCSYVAHSHIVAAQYEITQ